MRYTIWPLECRAAMACMEADSIDSIVTDPPYGLSKEPDVAEVMRHWLAGDDYQHTGSGFMGKSWDSFVPGPAVWREAYRVLKPGGHLIAFFGTRTYDLGVMALRLAGFEVRDQLAWVYGSGFPKSHDISKGIDKLDAAQVRLDRAFRFTAWIRSQGITARQIDDLTDTKMGSHYTTHPTQPAVATRVLFEMIRPLFREVPPEWVERLVDERTVESENFNRREVVGLVKGGRLAVAPGAENDRSERSLEVTSPATPEAAQWQGWGTALKPAFEPIVLARKPLSEKTVAANVLRWGTGAINVDACRIGDTVETWPKSRSYAPGQMQPGGRGETMATGEAPAGRWPANFTHDGSDEVLAHFPVTGPSKANSRGALADIRGGKFNDSERRIVGSATVRGFDDAGGSAARFFYCPKASKADRNRGLDDATAQPSAASEFRPNHAEKAANGEDGNPYGRFKPLKNFHPTVKPTALMQWLCRMVTQPGGVVLDPFMGSGSTGVACMLEGFQFVGCEMTEEYLPIAEARIASALSE